MRINTPTQEQLDVYYAVQDSFLRCDAENALLNYFGMEASMEDLSCPEFEEKNPFTLEDAINPKSKHYVLDAMVEEFKERQDMGISGSAIWDMVVERVVLTQ